MRNFVHKHSINLNRHRVESDKTKDLVPEVPELIEIVCDECGAKNFLTPDEFECKICGKLIEEN